MPQGKWHWSTRVAWDGLWMMGSALIISAIVGTAIFLIAGTQPHDGAVRLDDGRTVSFSKGSEYDRIVEQHRGHILGAEFEQGHVPQWLPVLLIPLRFSIIAVYVLVRDRHAVRVWFRPQWSWIALGGACGLVAQAAAIFYTRSVATGGIERHASQVIGWLIIRPDFQIVAVSLIPVVEEVYFRGRAFGLIAASSGVTAAVWVTAIVFAAMHAALAPILLPPYLLISLILGWLRAKSGGLLAPIAAHVAFNACALAAIRLGIGR